MTAMDTLCRVDASRLFEIDVHSKDGDLKFSGVSNAPVHNGSIYFDDFVEAMPRGNYLETWTVEDGDTIIVRISNRKPYGE